MNQSIQIFKPGKHTAMSGVALSFSDADLKATAAAYDPAKHDAPIVVGHPAHDAPAYGWIGSLSFRERAGGEGAALEACPIQVDPAFAEMVGRGAFKKISASFYSPDSPANPVPGVYYLRHVGFLGAQPPAVKGLRSPEFAEGEAGVVEFNEWDCTNNASLWRSLRDWIIGKFGQDEADKVVPAYTVKSLEQSAAEKIQAPQPAGAYGNTLFTEFTEPQSKGDKMSDAEKSRLAALEVENEKLKKSIADFVEGQARAKRDARHAEHAAFAESLVKAGKLLPATQSQTVALLDALSDIAGADGNAPAIEFGEGADKKTATALALYKAQLEAGPKLVEFGEMAGGNKAVGEALTDPTAIAAAAVGFQEAESKAGRVVTTAQAVQHIQRAQAGK